MKPFLHSTALALGLFTALPAAAQEIVGRGTVSDAPVTLFDDGTWSFDSETTADCAALAKGLSFCGSPAIWQANSTVPPGVTAQYIRSATQFAQVLAEGLGRDQGLSMSAIRTAVLTNAANSQGKRVVDIPVLDEEPIALDGVDGNTIVYFVNYNGTPVVFANSYFLLDSLTFQAMTYVIGAETYTEAHEALQADFLALLELTE